MLLVLRRRFGAKCKLKNLVGDVSESAVNSLVDAVDKLLNEAQSNRLKVLATDSKKFYKNYNELQFTVISEVATFNMPTSIRDYLLFYNIFHITKYSK